MVKSVPYGLHSIVVSSILNLVWLSLVILVSSYIGYSLVPWSLFVQHMLMAPKSLKETQLKNSKCSKAEANKTNWEDITCPICLDFRHNSVLLQCPSYGKVYRPFICDTDHLHSNCLERHKAANGVSCPLESPAKLDDKVQPTCSLCRGEVSGWIIVDEARGYLDKTRFCQGEQLCW